MTTQTTGTATGTPTLTAAERAALRSLRKQYRENHDLFSTRELARLTFVRWLVRTGRLEP